MALAWHREEPREVRPFFETIQAENALADSRIRLFRGGEAFSESSFDLEEIDFQKLDLGVQPVLAAPALWIPAGLKASDLEVVLIARHSFLKQSEVIERFAVTESAPPEWEVTKDVLERMASGRNLELVLALCLTSDRSASPGSPFVVGHWLAQKTFLLRSRANPALFDLRTRTDQDWTAAGYPAKTLYAVDYAGGMADEMEDGGSVATVYMHIDAHNKMVTSSLGDTVQPILAAEIMLSILLESRQRQVIEKVINGIRRGLKQSQSSASPPPPPRPKRLSFLERTLASFLTPSKKGTRPRPEVSSAPIHLTYDQEPKAEPADGALFLTASFTIRMKADEDAESLKARVRITCPVIEDGEEGDSLELSVEADAPIADDPEKTGWKTFQIEQNKPVKFRCRTDNYDPLWTVRFVPEVEAVEVA